MREIKFRLRNASNKIVGYEKWYTGSWDSELHAYRANPCWLYSRDGEYWTNNKIEHRFKDEFTGLKDSEDKEVWEGDIVECRHENVGVVKYDDWHEGGGRFFPIVENGYFCEICAEKERWYYFTVIGNIYENPELLEERDGM